MKRIMITMVVDDSNIQMITPSIENIVSSAVAYSSEYSICMYEDTGDMEPEENNND